jgi:hypothetical protein
MAMKYQNKILSVVAISFCLLSNSALAEDKSCSAAQKLLKDIDNEAALYYSESDYKFKNEALLKDISDLSEVLNITSLNEASETFSTAASNQVNIDSAMADVASAVHEWESELCFD